MYDRITSVNEGSVSDLSMIHSSMRAAIKELDRIHCDDPRKYFQVLVWAAKKGKEIVGKEVAEHIAQAKKDGWTIESHTWMGEDYNTFQVYKLLH
jgi:hypothetical protein